MESLQRLLSSKVINLAQYDTYVLYEINELGREYLKNILESSFLEKSEFGKMKDSYAWHDGRRSVWRDIKITILEIDRLLGEQDERERNPEYQYGSAADRFNSGFENYI
jgi:hypothetical protein